MQLERGQDDPIGCLKHVKIEIPLGVGSTGSQLHSTVKSCLTTDERSVIHRMSGLVDHLWWSSSILTQTNLCMIVEMYPITYNSAQLYALGRAPLERSSLHYELSEAEHGSKHSVFHAC